MSDCHSGSMAAFTLLRRVTLLNRSAFTLHCLRFQLLHSAQALLLLLLLQPPTTMLLMFPSALPRSMLSCSREAASRGSRFRRETICVACQVDIDSSATRSSCACCCRAAIGNSGQGSRPLLSATRTSCTNVSPHPFSSLLFYSLPPRLQLPRFHAPDQHSPPWPSCHAHTTQSRAAQQRGTGKSSSRIQQAPPAPPVPAPQPPARHQAAPLAWP